MAKRRKLEGKRPRPGQPPFVPTDEQRKLVGVLTAMAVPFDRIRMVIINPRSGKPIEVPTLKRAFAQEIELGRAQLDRDCAIAIAEGIRRGDIRFCALYARNRIEGWNSGKSSALP
jgi:hypothetical protein